MNQNSCPYKEKCKLYKNELLFNRNSEEIYKAIYCKNARWKECKRYLAFLEFGKTPDFIMPNSNHSMDFIANKIDEETPKFSKSEHEII